MLGVDARVPDDRNGGRFSQSLAGKQDWYGVQGGIWKSARLEARDPIHIAKAHVRTSFDLKTGVVSVSGELSRAAPATTLQVTLSRGGEPVARLIYHFRSERFDALLALPEAEPWSPEAPNLYDLVVELIVGDATVDAIERVVGFRRFEAQDGRLFLNGEPFNMFGALDQDWHPEEECRPPSAEFLEQRFANAKAMGLNTLRCHVKIPDPLYFDLADRLGLIVWLDMPYMQFLAPATREDVAPRVPDVGRNARASSLDRNLDAVQRGMGYRSRRQSGRPALADRDLRLGEDAGPRQPACRQFPLLSAQLSPQDRHRGLPLV